MPVVIDTDSSVVAKLLTSLPAGAHGVESVDRLGPWLDNRSEEFLVVLGRICPWTTPSGSARTCGSVGPPSASCWSAAWWTPTR